MRLDEDRNDHRDLQAGEITTALQQTEALRVLHRKLLTAKCFGLFNGRQIHSPFRHG